MRIQYGSVITGASGSLGGITASRNANGAYLRRKVKSINPNTVKQQNRRNAFGALSRGYKTLTVAQQNAWKTAGALFPYKNKLNVTSTYTAPQLYSKLNNQLAIIGMSPIANPPVPVVVDGVRIDNVVLTILSGVLLLNAFDTTTTDYLVPEFTEMLIGATQSMSAGINAPKKPMFRQLAQIGTGESLTDIDLTAAYISVFGTAPREGSNTFFEIWFVSSLSGQVGKRVQALCTFA